MREMKRGDLAFFYASGGKKGRVPGITGIMEIVKEHEADPGIQHYIPCSISVRSWLLNGE